MHDGINVRAQPALLPCPYEGFLTMFPVIENHAQVDFRHLPEAEREDAVAEAVASGFTSFVRLKERGKDPSAFPSILAKYATLHVKSGRHVGSKLNTRDVLSKAAQQKRGFGVQSLQQQEHEWNDILADNTVTPIPDQVSFRIDWPAFLKTLSSRHRRVIHYLALGHAPKWVASKFGLSAPRVTQLRRQWHQEWQTFIDEAPHQNVLRAAPSIG
jgi:hypothetical protein